MRWRTLTTTVLSICALAGSASAQRAERAWYSGFEKGFPGEWLDWDDGSFSTNGVANSNMSEAWTIVRGGEVKFAGEYVYKGWPVAQASDSHRAYPVIHVDIPSPLVNSFMVYLDVDYGAMSSTDWVHFATWGNNPDWDVHTLSVRNRKLEMAHLGFSYIGPTPQPEFPLRKWVRLTAYIHYDGERGYVRLWQDGVPMLEGDYDAVSGNNLMRAHWGWYSSGTVTRGVQYNDEIQIWTLDAPLTNLEEEPKSPYEPPSGGGAPGTAGAPSVPRAGAGGTAGAASPGTAGAGRGGNGSSQGGTNNSSAGRAGQGNAYAGRGGEGNAIAGAPSFAGAPTVAGSGGTSSAGTAGTAGVFSYPTDDDSFDQGCGCVLPGRRDTSTGWLAGALLLFGAALRRRRTR